MLNSETLTLEYTLESLDTVVQTVLKTVTHKTILFNGAMGTGKTTFIKALVKALGSTDEVSSPTYALVNTYQAQETLIYHFDLYRLKSVEEAYDFGIEDYLQSTHWLFIEWPDIIKDELADAFHVISLETSGQHKRILTLK